MEAFTIDKDVIRKTNEADKIPLIIDLDGMKNQLQDWFHKRQKEKEVIMVEVSNHYIKRGIYPEYCLRIGYVQGCRSG